MIKIPTFYYFTWSSRYALIPYLFFFFATASAFYLIQTNHYVSSHSDRFKDGHVT